MEFFKHLKFAAYFGFIASIVFALVDILSKIIAWSFQWFELYQVLITDAVVIIPLFVAFSLLLQLLSWVFKLRLKEEEYRYIYIASMIAVLVAFYGLVYLNIFLLKAHSIYEPVSILLSIIVLSVAFLPYFPLASKKIRLGKRITLFFKRMKTRKFLENLAFLIFVFIVISMILDVYQLNTMPAFKSSSKAEGKPNVVFIMIDT